MLDLGQLCLTVVADGKEAKASLGEFKESLGEAKDSTGKFSDFSKLKWAAVGTAVLAVGKALFEVGKAAVQFADEYKASCNSLQAQTGATDEEMQGLSETMKNIYANNYGEDFQDIADSLAQVRQQTDLTGEALQTATENAIALRDTFGFEVNESVRSADMMMKQFGITSDEAFNLIAQGAQKGLDKNGDLLDTINEYSVHFAQLGYDAEDMFNMLVNGAEAGTFSVDKLGDAVKEFGIRVKDGTADNAFQKLGMDVEATKQAFASGGEAAKTAMNDVCTALFAMEDPVEQNILGVEMFGTMWEDLGVEGVKALTDLNGEISATSDAMGKIKEIKYDDLGTAFEGIGRILKSELLLPLGEMLLPLLSSIANWLIENLPPMIENFKAFCAQVAAVFSEHGGTLKAIISGVWNAIKIVVQTALGIIKGVINVIMGVISGDWSMAWEGLKQIVSSVLEGIKSFIGNAMQTLVQIVLNIGGALRSAGANIINKLWEGLKAAWQAVAGWFSDRLNDIKGWLGSVDSMKGSMNSAATKIKSAASKTDGKHANGLSYVPYDGYVAELHKGERVLTRAENERYNQKSVATTENNITVNNYSPKAIDAAESARLYRKTQRDLSFGF